MVEGKEQMSSLPADEPPPGVKPAGCPSGGKQEEHGPFWECMANQKDLPQEMHELIDKHFWELLSAGRTGT